MERKQRHWRFSYFALITVVVSSVVWSPLFGNFTAERLPGLLIIAVAIGIPWGFITGRFLDWR